MNHSSKKVTTRWVVSVVTILALSGTLFYRKIAILEANLAAGFTSNVFEDSINSSFNPVNDHPTLRPLVVSEQAPSKIDTLGPGHYLVTFPKAFFGTLSLNPRGNSSLVVRFYETTRAHLDHLRSLGNAQGRFIGFYERRYNFPVPDRQYVLELEPRFRPRASDLPDAINAVLPFRQVELLGFRDALLPSDVVQLAVHYPVDRESFRFLSDNEALDSVVELARHTSLATTFSRLFVDGNRERRPYEADAYIQMLSHAVISSDYALARYTIEYLLHNPTWPTEWHLQMVFLAHAYLLYSGDTEYLHQIYPELNNRLLSGLADADGLISTDPRLQTPGFLASIGMNRVLSDLIDWPPSERLGFSRQREPGFLRSSVVYYLKYVRWRTVQGMGFHYSAIAFKNEAEKADRIRYRIADRNSVINMFRYSALRRMQDISCILGRLNDCKEFENKALRLKQAINEHFYSEEQDRYVDRKGGQHASFHSNLFALAFGVAREELVPFVREVIVGGQMNCSVYASQYLLEGLFVHDEDEHAIGLMTNAMERGWLQMMSELSSTMTTESWNFDINPEMDMNHGWGTAPLNVGVRYLAGIRPVRPGFVEFVVEPRPGNLRHLEVRTPTPRGFIEFEYKKSVKGARSMRLVVPPGSVANVVFPIDPDQEYSVVINGTSQSGLVAGQASLKGFLEGRYTFLLTPR